jgi:hypothetical protein
VKPVSGRVEVPGVRPATFKLVDKGEGLFDLRRSSGKIGNARPGKGGRWSAQFWLEGERWRAEATAPDALLRLIGMFVLATEARAAAARPVEETEPELKAKGRLTPEKKLGLEWARRLQAKRLADLDELIAACRERIEPDTAQALRAGRGE